MHQQLGRLINKAWKRGVNPKRHKLNLGPRMVYRLRPCLSWWHWLMAGQIESLIITSLLVSTRLGIYRGQKWHKGVMHLQASPLPPPTSPLSPLPWTYPSGHGRCHPSGFSCCVSADCFHTKLCGRDIIPPDPLKDPQPCCWGIILRYSSQRPLFYTDHTFLSSLFIYEPTDMTHILQRKRTVTRAETSTC